MQLKHPTFDLRELNSADRFRIVAGDQLFYAMHPLAHEMVRDIVMRKRGEQKGGEILKRLPGHYRDNYLKTTKELMVCALTAWYTYIRSILCILESAHGHIC